MCAGSRSFLVAIWEVILRFRWANAWGNNRLLIVLVGNGKGACVWLLVELEILETETWSESTYTHVYVLYLYTFKVFRLIFTLFQCIFTKIFTLEIYFMIIFTEDYCIIKIDLNIFWSVIHKEST